MRTLRCIWRGYLLQGKVGERGLHEEVPSLAAIRTLRYILRVACSSAREEELVEYSDLDQ